jgi:hypothetical protein
MGGAAKTPSGRQREGDSAAVVKVLGDVAGDRLPHPAGPFLRLAAQHPDTACMVPLLSRDNEDRKTVTNSAITLAQKGFATLCSSFIKISD